MKYPDMSKPYIVRWQATIPVVVEENNGKDWQYLIRTNVRMQACTSLIQALDVAVARSMGSDSFYARVEHNSVVVHEIRYGIGLNGFTRAKNPTPLPHRVWGPA